MGFRSYFGANASPDRFLDAIYSIVNSNVEMDSQPGLKDNPALHFDEEAFLPGQKEIRLRNNHLNTVIGDGKYSAARSLLGKNLHSIQKFYAHSNWVELDHSETADLIFGDLEHLMASNTTDTCDQNGSNFVSNNLTSGFFNLPGGGAVKKCKHGNGHALVVMYAQ